MGFRLAYLDLILAYSKRQFGHINGDGLSPELLAYLFIYQLVYPSRN